MSLSIIDPRNNRTVYTYDAMDRPTHIENRFPSRRSESCAIAPITGIGRISGAKYGEPRPTQFRGRRHKIGSALPRNSARWRSVLRPDIRAVPCVRRVSTKKSLRACPLWDQIKSVSNPKVFDIGDCGPAQLLADSRRGGRGIQQSSVIDVQ